MQLGRYRLEEQVGQGGMAVVWRGFDTQLRRTVAVKVLHPHLHAREEIRRRFDREAHAVARLHHPHILNVYDFSGLETDPSYLVTEFIRGTTLRLFAEQHSFDPPELAAACLLPIAEALEHAHAAGVVHRDLKPENVMVREDGVVKLTDFGIAALLDPDEKFTVTGSILGSPAHLAPETIEGKAADPRSDLFSFGTILYWLSCGKLPFEAPTPAALLRRILSGELLDPRAVRPSVGDAQARLILRCLEREPERRYQSAGELKRELLALLDEAGVDAPLEEVAAFVRGMPPEEHAKLLRARLVERSLLRGEEALAQRRTSAALAAFGRALALEPGDARALRRVDRIRRRAKMLRVARNGALAASACALIAGAGVQIGATALRAKAEAALRWARAFATSTSTPSATSYATPNRDPNRTRSSTSNSNSNSIPNSTSTPTPTPSSTLRPNPAQPRHAAPILVTLRPRYSSAEVIVDDKDLGQNVEFRLPLAPGAHRVTVQHQCCADGVTEILVAPGHDRFRLEVGAPKPATLAVIGAAPDATVLLDGSFLCTLQDPGKCPVAMTEPEREVTLTIGDRVVAKTLTAGRTNTIDLTGAP